MGRVGKGQPGGPATGFDLFYGLELIEISDAEVRARVKVADAIRQPAGLVHGGIYAAIAESMASTATALAVAQQGQTAVGLANSTSFLRPITDGVVHALASRVHRGRTTWVWEVRFSDELERICALTRMTVAVRRADEPGWGSA